MADANLNEIRQRLTRVESRICRIADYLGAPVGDPKKTLEITYETDAYVDVTTPVLDLTISEVIHFLHSAGKEGRVAYMYFKGQCVATVNA